MILSFSSRCCQSIWLFPQMCDSQKNIYNLSAKGVPLDAIREQLGHASLNTTLSYIFNPLTEQETYNLMVNAL